MKKGARLFSFADSDTNYRGLIPGESIIIYVGIGSTTSNDSKLNHLKPVLATYLNNHFLSVETLQPVIPCLNNYSLPGWEIFNQVYNQALILELIKQRAFNEFVR